MANTTTNSHNTLVLFTHSFPYGDGEQFIETEIPYLVRAYDRVIIVPFSLRGVQRPIHERVIIDTSLADKKTRKWQQLIFGIVQGMFSRFCLHELSVSPSMALHPRALIRLFGMFRDAKHIQRWFPPTLASGNVILYAYWLDALALGIGLVKEQYPQLTAVARAHNLEFNAEAYSPPFLPFQSSMLERLDRVYAIGNFGLQYLQSRYPRAALRCEVDRLGVTPIRGIPSPSYDGVFRIASCSNMESHKNIELIIHSICELSHKHPSQLIEWRHIGDGPLRIMLANVAKHCMPATVDWDFIGAIPNLSVRDYYTNYPVDVFVNTSAFEGIPVSIMEAQSCGIPVIAPDIGGICEIVSNENGILLAETPTIADIAFALSTFIGASPNILEKRVASIDMWKTKYNATINYAAFTRHLLEINAETANVQLRNASLPSDPPLNR